MTDGHRLDRDKAECLEAAESCWAVPFVGVRGLQPLGTGIIEIGVRTVYNAKIDAVGRHKGVARKLSPA